METTGEISKHLTEQVVYLMGISFFMGCLFTIFILAVLDMMRRMREDAPFEEDLNASE